MYFRMFSSLSVMAILTLTPTLAVAGPYTDDMSKCLVASASEQDQKDLIIWIYSAMAQHPSVAPMANISEAQKKEITKKAANLFLRLLTDACKTQTQQAIKYEGNAAIEQSFSVLGQVAMRSLMSDPAVAKSLGDLDKDLDKQKLKEALGIKDTDTPVPKK